MSAPDAVAVHRTRRRLRLRVAERRGDEVFFERVAEELRRAPGVRDVAINARTASLLVRHDGDLDAISAHVARTGVLAWSDRADRDVLCELRERLRAADVGLHERTQGRWSVDALAFYGMLAAGAWQVANGSVLPAGISLLMKALSMVERRDEDAD